MGEEASPAFADIDGDGDLDAFVGESYGNTIFFENTGTAVTPAFDTASTNPFGLTNLEDEASPAFADIDGDGDLDALIGQGNGSVSLFENVGTDSAPSFGAPSILARVRFDVTPTFADIDGDGDLDALAGDFYGNTVFLENTGTSSEPAFAAPPTSPFGLGSVGFGASPYFADIDADGDLDAVVGEAFGRIFSFVNSAIPPACADGLDDDGDGLIDGLDPGCVSASDRNEFDPPAALWQCAPGPELLALAPLFAAARRRGGRGSGSQNGPRTHRS